jgi:hypothetical protein
VFRILSSVLSFRKYCGRGRRTSYPSPYPNPTPHGVVYCWLYGMYGNIISARMYFLFQRGRSFNPNPNPNPHPHPNPNPDTNTKNLNLVEMGSEMIFTRLRGLNQATLTSPTRLRCLNQARVSISFIAVEESLVLCCLVSSCAVLCCGVSSCLP